MRIEYGLPADTVLPNANYSPWNRDTEFLDAYEKIKDYTAVDNFRCYELWKIAGQLRSVGGDIIEVGVWKGGTGVLLGLCAEKFLPRAEVHLCDTFTGIVNASERDPFYKGGEFSETSVPEVSHRIVQANLTNVFLHQGEFPSATGPDLSNKKFCLAHIDVDVYLSAKQTFDWVWPRLLVGGVVVFDDYGFVDCAGVTTLVDEEITGGADRLVLHNLNGHALIVKTRV